MQGLAKRPFCSGTGRSSHTVRRNFGGEQEELENDRVEQCHENPRSGRMTATMRYGCDYLILNDLAPSFDSQRPLSPARLDAIRLRAQVAKTMTLPSPALSFAVSAVSLDFSPIMSPELTQTHTPVFLKKVPVDCLL